MFPWVKGRFCNSEMASWWSKVGFTASGAGLSSCFQSGSGKLPDSGGRQDRRYEAARKAGIIEYLTYLQREGAPAKRQAGTKPAPYYLLYIV